MDKVIQAVEFVVVGILVLTWQNYVNVFDDDKLCLRDFLENKTVCSLRCPNGSFALPGMKSCRAFLDCSDSVEVKKVLVSSVVKKVYLAEWNNYDVVISKLSSPAYKDDFHENLNLLILLGPNNVTVQFLGHCNDSIITRYHKLGSALNLQYHLQNSLKKYNTMAVRLKLCINYASILQFLHSEMFGTRVMCDSSTLEKTLSQYLLTDDLGLVINDLDALPQVNTSGIVCGKKQLDGTFVAPEQLWPFEGEFMIQKMPLYDEKTDVWKIPDVCTWFLGNSSDADLVKFNLFNVHKMCKNVNPKERPNVTSVLNAYQSLWNELFDDENK